MRRHVGPNPYCEFFSKEIEMESHIFFGFPFFSSIWSAAPFSISLEPTVQNFVAGRSRLKEALDEANFELAFVGCWNIWNFRNDYIHNAARGDR